MKKRVTAMLLTLAMVATLAPAPVFAAGVISDKKTTTKTKDGVTLTKSADWTEGSRTDASITLAVSGADIEVTEGDGANVMLVMDTTGSMGPFDANGKDITCTEPKEAHTMVASFTGGEISYKCPLDGKMYKNPEEKHKVLRMQAAQYYAIDFVQALTKEGTKNMVSVISFADEIMDARKRAENPAWQTDNAALVAFINNDGDYEKSTIPSTFPPMYPLGGTNYDMGFVQAKEMLDKLPAERKSLPTLLVFLTDGEPDKADGKDGAAKSKEIRDLGVRIIGIAFSGEDDKEKIKNALGKVVSEQKADNIWFSGSAEKEQDLGEVLKQIQDIAGAKHFPAATGLTLTDTIADGFELDTKKPITDGDGKEVPAEKVTVSGNTITWAVGDTTEKAQSIVIPIKATGDASAALTDAPTNKGEATLQYSKTGTDGKPTAEKSTIGVASPKLDRLATGEKGKGTIAFDWQLDATELAMSDVQKIENVDAEAGKAFALGAIKPKNASDADVSTFEYGGYSYAFVGWSKTEDGESVESVTPEKDEITTVYAIWKKTAMPGKVTIQYYKGAVDKENNNLLHTVNEALWPAGSTFGENLTDTVKQAGVVKLPNKDNYNTSSPQIFTRKTTPVLGNEVVEPGIQYGLQIVYPEKTVGKVKVSFDVGEHGTMGTGKESYEGEQGKTLQAIVGITPTVNAKEGYKFVGWKNGESWFDPTQVANADISFTAQYEIDLALWFSVRFHANDDTDKASVLGAATRKGEMAKVLENAPKFENSRYTLDGWAYTAEGDDPVGANDEKTIAKDETEKAFVEVYAKWKSTVHFKVENGTFAEGKIESSQVFTKPKVDKITPPTGMTPNEGYAAGGQWYTVNVDGTKDTIIQPKDMTIGDGKTYIYSFAAKGTYTVTFAIGNSDAASFAGTTDNTVVGSAYKDENYEGATPVVKPKSDGWKHTGWIVKIGSTADETVTADALANWFKDNAITDNTVLTAQYSAKVTFDPNGGTVSNPPTGATTEDGKTVIEIPVGENAGDVTAKPPTDKDLIFDGWYNGDEKIDPTNPINKPLDLTAQYRGIQIEKTSNAEGKALKIGDTITYEIKITNIGTRELKNITVKDTLTGIVSEDFTDGELTIETLEAGETKTYTYTYTVQESDYTAERGEIKNEASVSVPGTASSDPITRSDEVIVNDFVARKEVTLGYEYQTLNADGSDYGNKGKGSVSLGFYYEGEEIKKEAIAQKIQETILPKIPTDKGLDFANYIFKANDEESMTGELPESYTVGEENQLWVKYPLQTFTLTFKPGTGGTLALGEKAKNATVGESKELIFSKIPYGASINKWFSGSDANGSLDIIKQGNEEGKFLFAGWDTEIGDEPVTANKEHTAQWVEANVKYTVQVMVEGITEPVHSYSAGGKVTEPGTPLNITLVAEDVWQAAVSAGKVSSEGYVFQTYQLGEDTPTTEGKFAVRDDAVIKVNFKPYDLAVWHVYAGGTPVFDAESSKTVLESTATVKADTSKVSTSTSVRYSSTDVKINGEQDTGIAYGSTIEVPNGMGAYQVTFHYKNVSSGGGGGGGGGSSRPDIDIEDEDVPLAGLETTDHFAYIIGYADGGIHPEARISRGETATIFFRLLNDLSRTLSWDTSVRYTDTWKGLWSNNAISTMTTAEIVTGYSDGTFRPDEFITRAEFAAIAARFDRVKYEGEDKFSDISGHWAAPYINRAAEKGWINGYEDGTFHPDEYIMRAEAVTLVNNVLGRHVKADGMLEGMKTWNDCKPADWFYLAIQEATNSHDYERATDVSAETWTKLTSGRDWKALESELATANSGAVVKSTEPKKTEK